jgi:hypothetical protein
MLTVYSKLNARSEGERVVVCCVSCGGRERRGRTAWEPRKEKKVWIVVRSQGYLKTYILNMILLSVHGKIIFVSCRVMVDLVDGMKVLILTYCEAQVE